MRILRPLFAVGFITGEFFLILKARDQSYKSVHIQKCLVCMYITGVICTVVRNFSEAKYFCMYSFFL
jgi:hypothetical protein